MRVAVIVLAAGAGRRMGGPKALARWRGSLTFLDAAITLARDAGLAPRLVVLDPSSPIFPAAKSVALATGTRVVENADAARGMLSSVRAGLAALHQTDPAATHAALLPVDHPGISPATLTGLLAAVKKSPDSIVVPSHGGRRGHPGIFPASLFPALLSAPDQEGARWVLAQNPGRIVHVGVDDEACVKDVDTPEDLARR